MRANRELVCRRLGIDARRVRSCTQVHGTVIRTECWFPAEDGAFLDPAYRWPEGDGLVSEWIGGAVGVFGADCLPVLIWHRERPRVAAVHAGWRGLVDGVLEGAVDALGGGAALGAAIGTGVGPCCYPVSAEVRERFAIRFGDGVVCGAAVDLSGAAVVALHESRGAARGGLGARRLHLM